MIKRQAFFEKRQMRHDFLIAVIDGQMRSEVLFSSLSFFVSLHFIQCILCKFDMALHSFVLSC
jgi:hypothetical protein